jgi:hypothetical protein
MGALAIPIAVGAAVGGGSSLLRGQGLGGALKGAALGGGMGAATGGLGGALSGSTASAPASLLETASPLAQSGLPSFADVGGLSSTSLGGSATGALDGASAISPDAVMPTMDLSNSTGGITEPSLLDKLKALGSVDNTIGAAKLMASMPPRAQGQAPQAQSAPMKAATEMKQALTAGLLDNYSQPVRRKNFSLLG